MSRDFNILHRFLHRWNRGKEGQEGGEYRSNFHRCLKSTSSSKRIINAYISEVNPVCVSRPVCQSWFAKPRSIFLVFENSLSAKLEFQSNFCLRDFRIFFFFFSFSQFRHLLFHRCHLVKNRQIDSLRFPSFLYHVILILIDHRSWRKILSSHPNQSLSSKIIGQNFATLSRGIAWRRC